MRFSYKDVHEVTYPMEIRIRHTRPPQAKPVKIPKDSAISVSVEGVQVSLSLVELLENRGILYGHTGRPANGVTTATLGLTTGELGEWRPLVWASASCSRKDQFCKKTGRELALSRLVDDVLHKDERLGEALGLFLAGRGWK